LSAGYRPALPWWQARLRNERDGWYEWIIQLMRDEASSLPLHERRQRLSDVLDAYAQLDVSLEGALPVN